MISGVSNQVMVDVSITFNHKMQHIPFLFWDKNPKIINYLKLQGFINLYSAEQKVNITKGTY
jgi:hypothetical protein